MKAQKALFTYLGGRSKTNTMGERILSSLLLSSLFLISCNNVVFDKPQPVDGISIDNLTKAFPGIYIGSDNDTLRISKTTITLGNHNTATVTGTLGVNMEVRGYSDGFIVNLSDSVKGRLVWIPFLFRLRNDSLYISFSDIGSNQLVEIENQIKHLAPTEVIKNGNGEYKMIIVKPKSTSEFEKLVNAGIFNKTVSMRMEKQKP